MDTSQDVESSSSTTDAGRDRLPYFFLPNVNLGDTSRSEKKKSKT